MQRHVLCLAALLAAAAVSTAFNTAPGRLGCYEFKEGWLWKHWQNTLEKNSANSCKNLCHEFKYAGVQYGQHCLCGDKLPSATIADSRCNTPCSGDQGQTCGGWFTVEIFTVQTNPAMSYNHLGCFQDGGSRGWTSGQMQLQTNSPQRCANACRGFRYAGLKAGNLCFCGDSSPGTSTATSSCSADCSGLPGKTCGGSSVLDVYEVSESSVQPEPNLTEPEDTFPEIFQCPACPTTTQEAVVPPVQVVGCIPMEYKHQSDLGIYKLYAQRKTWDDAWQQCEDDEAHLVIVNSEDEAAFLRSLIAQVPSETHMHAGFHDQANKGTYLTLYGDSLARAGYNKWSAKYPLKHSASWHCGSLDTRALLAQVEDSCSTPAIFVCEKKSDSQDANNEVIDFNERNREPDP